LIFVALILIAAYRHTGAGHMAVSLEMRLNEKVVSGIYVFVAYSRNVLVVAIARLSGTQINRR